MREENRRQSRRGLFLARSAREGLCIAPVRSVWDMAEGFFFIASCLEEQRETMKVALQMELGKA